MDFLKDYIKRMKSVGRYAVLMNNSFNKTTWKQYGIESMDEQVNMLFTVLLFIMEQSLKEENCTLDDIAAFIGEVDERYYKRGHSYDDLKKLSDFIVNVILCNSGSVMNFKGYDYDGSTYSDIHIDYIANKIVYLDNGVRRTSYYLTDDGYNMMLSTMELENNLKLTIHEMLFKLHLEKADYGRAVNDIKNVFDRLRIQTQKIQEAMRKIRQNALSYTVEEYREIVEENIQTLEDTRGKFKAHKEAVENRVREFEQEDINIGSIKSDEKDSIENLRIIESYLSRALDEHQKILGEHFDLKNLYDVELENYSSMTMIKRYNFRSEIYDRIINDAGILENIEEFFKPLFYQNTSKNYNIAKAFEYQKRIRKVEEDDEVTELSLDEAEYRQEQEELIRRRLKKYEDSLTTIVSKVVEYNNVDLLFFKEKLTEDEIKQLIPTLEIFREIIIEFLTEQVIDIDELRKERSEHIVEEARQFRLNEMILTVLDNNEFKNISKIYAKKDEAGDKILFENVINDSGEFKNISCSNVKIWYE